MASLWVINRLELEALDDELLGIGADEVPTYLEEPTVSIPTALPPTYVDQPSTAAPEKLDEFGLPVATAEKPNKITA